MLTPEREYLKPPRKSKTDTLRNGKSLTKRQINLFVQDKKMTKLHDNPYKTEYWNALKNNVFKEVQKSRDEIDNAIILFFVKLVSLMMAIAIVVIYLFGR